LDKTDFPLEDKVDRTYDNLKQCMNNEQSILPTKLYKYVKPDRLDVLIEQTILFSPSRRLNDPFEMRPRFIVEEQTIRKQWDKWVEKKYALRPPECKMSWPEFVKAVEEKNGSWEDRMQLAEQDYGHRLPERYQDAASSTFAMLCLSEHADNPDNLLMWAHYTQSHTGLVFQFDTSGEFFRRYLIRRVSYKDERPVYDPDGDTRIILLTKSVEWCYEAEWCQFRRLTELNSRKLKNGEDGHFADLPARNISSIFLGCQISPADREKTLAALKLPGREHIRAFQATLHPTRYTLTFCPIN
jgi:hypothetical protein